LPINSSFEFKLHACFVREGASTQKAKRETERERERERESEREGETERESEKKIINE